MDEKAGFLKRRQAQQQQQQQQHQKSQRQHREGEKKEETTINGIKYFIFPQEAAVRGMVHAASQPVVLSVFLLTSICHLLMLKGGLVSSRMKAVRSQQLV